MRILSIWLALALLLGQGLARPPAVHAADRAVTAAALATVQIITFDRQDEPQGWGSGVLISSSGQVLTNYHVVDKNRRSDGRVAIWLPNTPKANRVDDFTLYWGMPLAMASDPAADLALVQIELTAAGDPLPAATRFPALPLGDSDQLQTDDEIHVLGYPGLARGSLITTRGRIIGFQEEDQLPWLLTDAVISGGSSGGAVINQVGELVAIPTQTVTDKESGNTFGYLRPVNLVLSLLPPGETPTPSAEKFEILCADDFTSNKNGWALGHEADADLIREDTIVQGALYTVAEFHADLFGWLTVPHCTAQDFALVVDVQVESATSAESGVVFVLRSQETEETYDYYQVIYYLDNSYEINVRTQGEWQTVQERTPSRAFDLGSGQSNQLAVVLIGEELTLYANGAKVATVSDDTLLTEGQIGLGVTGDPGDTVEVRFDNLEVINPTPKAIIFHDQFVDNRNGWQLGRVQDQLVDCTDKITQKRLEQRVRIKTDYHACFSATTKLVAQDFWLTVDATWQKVNDKERWLAIPFRFDEQTGNHYQVRIDNTGAYILELYLADEWYTIQTWTRSSAFNLADGAANTIQLWVRGPYITLVVNGVELTTVEDDQLSAAGQIMLGAGGEAGVDSLLFYDNLLVRHTPPTENW